MSPVQPVLDRLCAEIAALSARIGERVDPAALGVLDRAAHLPLSLPDRVSPNGACRLVRAGDGWLAVNLARAEDVDLLPAWLEMEVGAEAWPAVERGVEARRCAELLARAALLGLPVSGVGEIACRDMAAPVRPRPGQRARTTPLKAVDLSALWAGPLCGAVLAAMGAEVLKVESSRRPDPTRRHTPGFFRALNGGKGDLVLDLAAPHDQARLRDLIRSADVLITSCRRRALPSLGLDEDKVFAAAPGLVWVAITGYGWAGGGSERVAFGDDAAAAGGLVAWRDGAPRFLGDALADPVSGLMAAAGALGALESDRGCLVDVAMARCAAAGARFLQESACPRSAH